ncbi:Flp pilus assembly protein TadG [Rhizobium aquaticum]|uniref:Flp pilus assembly protein TadG n=1 Tax=Rhizobium aquaticum TaxID=1549636 RepID=A0ABV2J4W2_9HYPH
MEDFGFPAKVAMSSPAIRSWRRRASGLIKRFRSDRSGNFALLTVALVIPITLSTGLAIDVARMTSAKITYQQAVDSAVLAAAAKFASTGTADPVIAQKFMSGNSSGATATPITFTTNADGTVTGSATFQMKLMMMRMSGLDTVSVNISSKANAVAVTKLSQASLQITAAQGAYSKDIYFFTRDAKGAILSQTLVLKYRYDGTNKTYTPPIGGTTTINVGDYASYGYRMDIYVDNSYKGKTNGVPVVTHYSDDADAAKWTRSTGTCADPNGIKVQWEDGGDANYLDFQYIQKCTQTTNKVTDVRLVK